MAAFVMHKSIVGKRFGLSSTGGILAASESTTFDSVAVMRDSTGARLSPLYEPLTDQTTGETFGNSGVSMLTSSTVAALTYILGAPVAGVYKEVICNASATAVTIDTSATTIIFTSSGASSTSLSIAVASTLGGAKYENVLLRGISTTRWQVLAKSPNVTLV